MDEENFIIYMTQAGLSSITRRHYVDSLRRYFREYSSFEENSIKKLLIAILQRTTESNYNRNAKAFRHYCKFIGIEPFPSLKMLKEKPKMRVILSDEQIEKLCAGESKYDVAFSIHAFTGCRTSDIVNLEVSSIDVNIGVIYFHHGKGGKSRKVPILEPLKSRVAKYLETYTGKYFLEWNGKQISPRSYTKAWEKKKKLNGITSLAQPHSLRHSFLTNTLGNGASLYAIQDIVGHVSAETTRKYYHGNLDLMKKAAAKLPLAQKHSDPEVLVEQMKEIINEFLGKDLRFDKEALLEAQKWLHRSIKK